MSVVSLSSLDEMNIHRSVSDSEYTTSFEDNKIQSLIQLIDEYILSNKVENEARISPEGIKTMHVLLKHEINMLKEIDIHLSSILKNGKLDAGDIPDLILLMKTISNMYSPNLKKLKITRGELLKCIHDILVIIVKSDLTRIENKDLCLKLVDSSTTLLEATIELDETFTCGCLFRKKK